MLHRGRSRGREGRAGEGAAAIEQAAKVACPSTRSSPHQPGPCCGPSCTQIALLDAEHGRPDPPGVSAPALPSLPSPAADEHFARTRRTLPGCALVESCAYMLSSGCAPARRARCPRRGRNRLVRSLWLLRSLLGTVSAEVRASAPSSDPEYVVRDESGLSASMSAPAGAPRSLPLLLLALAERQPCSRLSRAPKASRSSTHRAREGKKTCE